MNHDWEFIEQFPSATANRKYPLKRWRCKYCGMLATGYTKEGHDEITPHDNITCNQFVMKEVLT